MYAEVIVDISHEAIDKSFSYRIPKDMELHVGDPVLVPFGREKKRAYVIKMSDTSEYPEDKIRDIISPLKKEFSLENTLLDLAIWMSREYGCTLNQCLKTVLPVKKKTKKRGKTGELLLKRETAPVELNQEQKGVLQGIRNNFSKGGTSALLFGVTGSGKTEVYLQLMEDYIREGKEVIFLIPEISLSFQTRSRIEQRFPGMLSVLHSKMSQGERAESMEKCRLGEVKILMGPRSACLHRFPILVSLLWMRSRIVLISRKRLLAMKQEKLRERGRSFQKQKFYTVRQLLPYRFFQRWRKERFPVLEWRIELRVGACYQKSISWI